MKNLSIRTKLVLASICTIVVAMAALAFANHQSAQRAFINEAQDKTNLVIDGTVQQIESWLQNKKNIVKALAPAASSYYPLAVLDQARESGMFISSYIGWANKRFVTSPATRMDSNYDPTSRPWYTDAAAAETEILTNPYVNADDDTIVVTLASPIKNNKDDLIAVAAADIGMQEIVNLVRTTQPTPNSYAMLIDGSGRIIAHPDNELSLKSFADHYPQVHEIGLGKLAQEQEAFRTTIDDMPFWINARHIPGSSWSVVIATHQGDALESLSSMRNQAILTSLIMIALAAFVLSIVTRALLRRLGLLQVALEDIASGEGDLTRRLDESGNDELAKVGQSFNVFVRKISETISSIRMTAESVNVASAQIAAGNTDLAARTEQAAAAIQETASSMEELASTVRQTADAGNVADQIANNSRAAAIEGGQLMVEVVDTMQDINNSSQRMSDIVGVIDSIAFQTNILALNAAVEAARANEHGHGFAVVAGEVRSLAQRSAQSAREIRDLILANVDRVNAGSELVRTAGGAMDKIVTEVQHLSDIIGEIKVAANEQNSGISQVGVAINELEATTQQNSSLVAESAAASASLSAQANALSHAVSGFRTES
ncbi:methyl-accepting chemotaxis protein [Paenalcaligenes hominis]|uniref:methyl-accepting chemotaxis protein n=1 Tax=Paenalcaligenes hominis TaxID=643674 RepID=UPI0035261046